MDYLKNKRIGLALSLILLFIIPYIASAQFKLFSEERKIFAKAESFFLFEEYELANQLYLLIETPENMNIKYKIGVCYLNIPGEKEKSIPYLEEAVKTAYYNSKTKSFRENMAPLDAYFFLARAYMINNDLEKAIKTFVIFEDLISQLKSKKGMVNREFIEQQIKACDIAIKLKETPVAFKQSLLSEQFSFGAINENPAVSFDGNSIVYTERRGMVNAIFYSTKVNGVWQPPRDITAELRAGEDCSSSSLNYDGTELFLYKTDNYDGAIYSSTLTDGVWTPIKKLNRNINTKYYESHAAISADGQKLYFTSNREGGYGGLDIYVSEKNASGDWGPAVNLGPTINTPYNEDTPFITQDGITLYFSSEGHTSMGGYDIFRSKLVGTTWVTPENVGFPINSTDDDKFYQPADNGATAYYSMTTGYKKRDIMYLEFDKAETLQTFEINGVYSLSDTTVYFDKNYFIYLLNSETKDTVDVGYPNRFTGYYSFVVPAGKYTITYGSAYYFSHTIDTIINQQRPTLTIDVSLKPDPVRRQYLATGLDVSEYETINLQEIPEISIASIESILMVVNVDVRDVNDKDIDEDDVLYYTVQVIALYNPVDVSYFKNVNDIRVIFNQDDRFFRYTTGLFGTSEEAYAWREELLRRGYPDDIFVKQVLRR